MAEIQTVGQLLDQLYHRAYDHGVTDGRTHRPSVADLITGWHERDMYRAGYRRGEKEAMS